MIMVFVVHVWAYFYQKCVAHSLPFVCMTLTWCRDYTRETIQDKIDIHESPYVSRLWLYIFCGLLDSMWQTTAYWFMGAMSNDPAKLANFSGFCACLTSFLSNAPPLTATGFHFRFRSDSLAM